MNEFKFKFATKVLLFFDICKFFKKYSTFYVILDIFMVIF